MGLKHGVALAAASLLSWQAAAQSIIALPDSGTADAGIASQAIANVAANDTVNGAQAVLGPSGNATVTKLGTTKALLLNPTTGAVTTVPGAPAGTYSMPYQLCDLASPPHCATTTDTVKIITPVISPIAESGTAAAGIASTPIENVTANDAIDGAPAVLGPSGNATVVTDGKWQPGIALNEATGAVSIGTTVRAGTYSIPYTLCDKNVPAKCATAADTMTVTPIAKETQASSQVMVDIEFDWARDGVYCSTCNFGESNARFNWTDTSGNLWVGHVDQATGAFTPAAGENELVDTTGFYYSVFGNGAEWAFSTQNGQVISQLVYTRFPPGSQATSANAGAAFATPGASGWTPTYFPGTAPGPGVNNTVNPLASQCNSDPYAVAYMYGLAAPQALYWEPVSLTRATAPTITPFVGAYAGHRSAQKPGIRWVPCTHQLVYVGPAAPDQFGNVYDQVFWYDVDTQVLQQVTFEPTSHAQAYMFQAPEFDDAYVLVTVSNADVIEIYQESAVGGNGAPTFNLINQIISSDPAEPYMVGAEPFIHCNPTCQTYLFMELHSAASHQSNSTHAANGVGITNIDPAHPLFKILIPEAATPNIQRIDLEYYITANGPYLYYDRDTIATATTAFKWGNRFFVDMGLGAPSGPCVGSSAEGGLKPGC